MKPLSEIMRFKTELAHCETHGDYQSIRIGTRLAGCPVCTEAIVKASREAEIEERKAGDALAFISALELPKRFAKSEIKQYGPNGDKAMSWLSRVINGDSANLIIWGSVGNGKSSFACALAREAASRRFCTRYVSVRRYLRLLRQSWSGGGITEAEVFSQYANAPLLILDDVGTESGEKDASRIYDVIDRRSEECLPTVYVTNLLIGSRKAGDSLPAGAYLLEAVGERGYSRMVEEASHIKMIGEDRRRARKVQP